MAYLVLARKYRPQTFEQVVGQGHVTQTLINAIQAGRVAHAMLFSGPRGTGKTTIARILAKAMNCESGPTPVPCNACRSCLDITACRGVDVYEIDGASNNSVDQVRELRDNCRYMPAHSRHKIYIIDEVHMLSIAAFNALLKTLEEPPGHVMFLFATTEAHKIPITILSRCQRHDLRRIELAAIVQQLEALCGQESVSISSSNLWAVARESGGSMRDALSLLDQVLACSDGAVEDVDVLNLLGTTDRRVLFDLSEAVFAKDISRVLAMVDSVFRSGQDLKRFFADLLMHFRHLMLIKMDAGPEILVDLISEEIDAMRRQAKSVSVTFIDQIFTALFHAETTVRLATHPRLAIEMVFFKIHQIAPALPIDRLIERMDSLLKDPRMIASSSTGIVEEQRAYGSAGSPSPADSPAASRHADALAAVHPSEKLPPGSFDGDQGHHSGSLDGSWSRVLEVIGETKPSIAAALARSQSVSVYPKTISVIVRDNEYTMNLIRKHLTLIESVCQEQANRGIQVDFGVGEANGAHAATTKQKTDEIRQRLLNHPLVADAVDVFEGKIEEIKIRQEG